MNNSIELVLTGEVKAGRYVVDVCGVEAYVTRAQFVVLCRLVLSRWTTRYGRCSLAQIANHSVSEEYAYKLIQRLREMLGRDVSCYVEPIESLRNGSYRLVAPPEEIALCEDFEELKSDLPAPLFEGLLRHCPQWIAGSGLRIQSTPESGPRRSGESDARFSDFVR